MPAFSPTGRVRIYHGAAKEAAAENLIELITKSAAATDNVMGTDLIWRSYVSHIICGVWNADVPWLWHLDRVIADQQRSYFTRADWVKVFIDSYFKTIN